MMKAGKRKEAVLLGEKYYFTGKPCKKGHIAKRITVNGYCTECSRLKSASVYETYYKDYVKKNKEKIKEISSRYQKNNKGKVNARTATRHAAKMQRTPAWLTVDEKWLIQEIYELAALRTKMTGFLWHVDHVLPLQGQTVSGLHTPWNLQVIPATDNIRKSNKVDV
jgi:hypothetical protein